MLDLDVKFTQEDLDLDEADSGVSHVLFGVETIPEIASRAIVLDDRADPLTSGGSTHCFIMYQRMSTDMCCSNP